ncbi:MAG: hypothetical protein HYT16_03210 [DPANN group archaeon]|nr:hypothetical protein [DPANN group archaeon]
MEVTFGPGGKAYIIAPLNNCSAGGTHLVTGIVKKINIPGQGLVVIELSPFVRYCNISLAHVYLEGAGLETVMLTEQVVNQQIKGDFAEHARDSRRTLKRQGHELGADIEEYLRAANVLQEHLPQDLPSTY